MKNNRRLRFLIAALIFVGALWRYWPLDFPLGPCGLGFESLEIGCSLAHNGAFSDPFAVLPTGPTAHLAPLFPAMIWGLIKWLGDGPASMDAVQWLGTFVLAFQLSLWPWASERLGMGFASGVIGGAAWILVGFTLLPMWEAPYAALLILILAVCMHRVLSKEVSTGFIFLTGALWGIIFLLNPVPLLAYGALLVWMICIRRIPVIQKVAMFVVPLVMISPWLIRNEQVFHRFVLIRDNLGMELWNSNNPCASFSFRNNRATGCFHHPNESVAEAEKVRSMGEYAYNEAKLRESLDWIKDNPSKFASLTRQRFLAFWFYTPGGNYFAGRPIPASIWIIWLIEPLSLAGLWFLFQRDRVAAGLLLVWLILFPLIYYLIEFIPRYRLPVLWASILPASFYISQSAQRVWQWLRKSHPALAIREIPAREA